MSTFDVAYYFGQSYHLLMSREKLYVGEKKGEHWIFGVFQLFKLGFVGYKFYNKRGNEIEAKLDKALGTLKDQPAMFKEIFGGLWHGALADGADFISEEEKKRSEIIAEAHREAIRQKTAESEAS